MTLLEAKQAVARKLDIDYSDISNNGLFTDADLQSYIQFGIMKAWDYKPWPFTQAVKTATTILPPIHPRISPKIPNPTHRFCYRTDFHPSGFLLLLPLRVFSKAPSLHRHYPASSLLWASPTPLQGRFRVMSSPSRWLLSAPPTGLPGSSTDLFHARCPQPPRKAQWVLACCFPTGIRLHPGWRTGPLRIPIEAESGLLYIAARVLCPHQFFARWITPSRACWEIGRASC